MAGSLHSFYIPVMGTGFTVDTPLSVARYGISSVVSLVDDVLIEQMREYWCRQTGREYQPIPQNQLDRRAKRITAYLNLLSELVDEQFARFAEQKFGTDSDLDRYFRLLPNSSPVAELYHTMLQVQEIQQRQSLERQLRAAMRPGQIEVNIMTKLDVPKWQADQQLPYMYNDAASALRGFALSNLHSSMVFSAGFNGTLYNYLTEFDDFFPDQHGTLSKKICLKVSDYRSALIQGKYLAKRGIWVSEYRVESPLNCGGHAFVNDGSLLGPILEEFSEHREQLIGELFTIYQAALVKRRGIKLTAALPIRVTAQGGVGTAKEHDLLLQRYQLDAVGWGSPFLLVPEATNVDRDTLDKLVAANYDQVILSRSSPIGIPFWTLVNSGSELHRQELIAAGTPGSLCPKGYTRTLVDKNRRPICQASRLYQQKQLAQLENSDLSDQVKELKRRDILAKACICHDLGGGVLLKHQLAARAYPAICPGPNIRYFNRITSLDEMIDHIYGRQDLLTNVKRSNVFINELELQILALTEDLRRERLGLDSRALTELDSVTKRLLSGIEYYRQLATDLPISASTRDEFIQRLSDAEQHLFNTQSEIELRVKRLNEQ